MRTSKNCSGKINFLPLIVLLVTLVVMATVALSIRYWQNTNRMKEGYRLGEIAYQQQNWSEAGKQYSYYLAKDNTNVDVLRKYAESNLNVRPRSQGNISQALSSYRLIIRNAPDDAEAVRNAAEIYIAMGAAGESELLIKDFLSAHPANDILHPLLAMSLSIQNKTEELQQALIDHPEFKTDYYQFLYSQLIKQDKYQQAVDLLKQIIVEYPSEIQAYDLLARVVNSKPELFDNDKPLKWLDKAIQSSPNNPISYLNRARFYIGSKQQEMAVSDLNKAVELSKDNPKAKLQAASLFSLTGNFGMARSLCAEVYDNDTENLEALHALLNYASAENDTIRLVEITDMALEKLSNTKRWDFIPSAIESYCIAGENQKANELIAEVEKTETMQDKVFYWKGLVSHNYENTNEEIMNYSKAIQLGFDNGKIKMLLANAYEKNNDVSSAIMQLKMMQNQNPNNITVLLKLAELYLKINNYNETQTLVSNILQLSPNNSRAILLSLNASIQGADRNKLKNDITYYNQLMDKLSSYKFGIQQPYQLKTMQFQLALMAEKTGDAEAILAEVENTNIQPEQLENLKIALLLSKGETEKAMEILNAQAAKAPGDVNLILKQVSLLVSNKQFDAAHALVDNTLNNTDSKLALKRLYFAKADLFLAQSGDNEPDESKAIEQLNILLTKVPGDISTLQRLLSFSSISSDATQAQSYINKIKDVEGQDGRVWKQEMARLRLKQDNTAATELRESISQLKDNIAANPSDTTSAIMLAMLYERTDQLLLAANLWQEAYNNDTTNVDFAVNACNCLQKAGKIKELDDLTAEIVRRYPDNLRVKNIEIARLLRSRENDKAEELLTELYNSGNCPADMILTLANIKTSKSDFEAAHKLYDELMQNESYPFSVIASKASVYAREKEYTNALLLCNKAIEKFSSAQAYLLKARILLDNEQNDEALKATEQALEQENITATDYLNICSIYISVKDTTKAKQIARKALSEYPSNAAINSITIQLMFADEDTRKEGSALLAKALEQFPDNNQLLFIKANELYSSQTNPDLEEAALILNNIVDQQPNNIQAWLKLGEIEFSRQRYQKVVDIAYRALSFNPENEELMFLKAQAESEISPEMASMTLKTLQKLNTSDANIAIKLASIFASQEQQEGSEQNIDDAIELLNKAEKLTEDPDQLETISLLRCLTNYKKGHKEAYTEISTILDSQPDNQRAFIIAVDMMVGDENWSEVSSWTAKWLANNTENEQAVLSALRFVVRKREIPEAKALILDITNQILAVNPASVIAMQVQASLLILDKDEQNTQKAIETYQAILKTEPDNTIAMNNLAWIISEDLNNPQEALKMAQKGLEITPDYADLVDTTGVIYYRLGEYEKAVDMFNKCINLYNSTNKALASTYMHLGKAYNQLNNKVQTTVYLKKALEYNEQSNTLSDNDILEIEEILK